MTNNDPTLSPNKQALLKIRELKQQLAAAQEGSGEPIAIVSMACRFPRTSNTPEKFWESLIRQDDLVSEIPDDRWDLDAFHDDDPEIPGKMYAKKGVFLENLDQMDPEFFGISPREATWVDPQQRLLMEVGWEAIERAGWIPDEISEHTGVFVGWMHNDYQNEASDSFLNLNPYIATGAAGSFLCGRLAYYLGLQGPSVAVDTACSSSLVALHLAIQSLQRGDCDRALVGGVNAICSPTTNILTCKLKALSPQGHSRAFDASADGYLRGEGCGVVTLCRLSDAQKNGDPILGIIRGSAVGHNGFSSGLTAPNPKAQEKVIRQALAEAGVDPANIGYLEAHGTGTELGDPIEAMAASAAYGENRTAENPLLIGSVKTNIGHLEAAAGMAGLIKVLLAIQHDSIPGQMNFETPNPHIPWDEIPLQVVTEPTAWPISDRRMAGVSAFGMSGTNAHVIVEAPNLNAAPQTARPTGLKKSSDKPPTVITLSAKNEDTIFELAATYADALAIQELDSLTDFAASTNLSRSHFDFRAAVATNSKQEAIELLQSISRGNIAAPAFMANRRRTPRVAWQFTGQGAQFVGMGRILYETQSVFRDAIDHCDSLLKSTRDGSLIETIFHDQAESPAIHLTQWTQPATFALQMGLVRLLESWGLRPDVVMGHSVGQFAAACVAGIMSWDEGLRLIAERGRIIGQLPPTGKMVAIFAPAESVKQAIANESKVSLAALNGTHVVISGENEAVDRVDDIFKSNGSRTKPLTTSHAFHSQLMAGALEPFSQFADQFEFQTPKLPIICNVTGQVMASDKVLDGNYWADHIRQAVQFAPGIRAVAELNCDAIIELGPQPVLTRMASAAWNQSADTLISCLQKTDQANNGLDLALAQMYVQGITPDFRGIHRDSAHCRVALPTYPFQRRRFWGPDKPRAAHAEHHTAHPLLGSKISLAGSTDESRYEGFIEPDSPSWMPDHEVMNAAVLPGAALVEMAIEAAGTRAIENVVFEQPVRPSGRTALQSVIKKSSDSNRSTFETFASLAGKGNWTRHFGCELVDGELNRPDPLSVESMRESFGETVSPDDFYQKMNSLGLNYGPIFRCIREFHLSNQEVLTKLETTGDVRGYTIAPTLLDAALHSLAVGLLKSGEDNLFLPVGIDRVECFASIESEAWCLAKWNQNEGSTRTADLTLFSQRGDILVKISGLRVQQVSLAAMRQMSGAGAERLVYELQWESTRLQPAKLESKKWLLISGESIDAAPESFAANFAAELQDKNHEVLTLTLSSEDELTEISETSWRFCGTLKAAWDRLLSAHITEHGESKIAGITWLLDGVEGSRTAAVDQSEAILNLIQSLLERKCRRLECGLQLITRNAISTGDGDTLVSPTQTQYWGLGRVLGAEQPELRCRLLDVCATGVDVASSRLAAEIALTETADNQHAIRNGQLFVPRLKQAKLKTQRTFSPRNDECYLVTGGLGKLGRQVAKWLAEQGARQVVLVSRRQPDSEGQLFIDEIESAGCQVAVHSADLGIRNEAENLFDRFGKDLPELAGIIHAAGVLDDGLIESQTRERFEKVLNPKVTAASLLDELSEGKDLDLFVLYSSAASVLGSPGQSNYATANAFLDGLASRRSQQGKPGLSINWGPWTEGMADDPRILKQLALQGITPLTVDEAHSALQKMIDGNVIQATVMDADWRKMRLGPTNESAPLLQALVGSGKKKRAAESALVSQLKKLNGSPQRALLLKTIQDSLQRILSTPEQPETDRPLIEMGLDSLMAVEFGTELQQMLGDQFNVGATMLFDYPTIDAITDHVLELIVSESETSQDEKIESAAQVDGALQSLPTAREDIAIVGMSCRFPGANDIDEFWDNLLNGVDSVCDIPNDRWDVDRFFSADREPGKMYTRRGGFLNDIGDFDAAFFGISEQEACWIDPQHRMLLENSYRALEDAGIPTSPLADSNVGVFMGIMGSDYAFLPSLDNEDIIKGFQGAGLSHSAGVGRISYLFGFEGPSVAVDTASSSSLVAVYQAMRSLQEGNCNLALAGGVNAILAPVNSLLMSKAGLLSPDGRCKSFSESADGFGRGEGCGVIVLKRLSDAENDGDRIMAVIRGGAVVHNGFSGGITSPSGKAQSRVIDAAIKDAGLAPSHVQYLEAHGTGTEFGDPMELGAAVKIYGKGRSKKNPLLVGSVKANISHLEAAGGSSGLIKTVLAIHHGVIPPQIHFDEPSPHIPWKRMPVKMVEEKTEWPACQRRTAGITALGLVGTNAHLVLSEPDSDTEPERSDQPQDSETQLLVASARSPEALRSLCGRYSEYLKTHPEASFDDVCFTLATGRRHFENRIAFLPESRESAIEKLRFFSEQGDVYSASNGAGRNGSHKSEAATHSISSPKLAWVFGESETDVAGKLRQLAEQHPTVREFIQECENRIEARGDSMPISEFISRTDNSKFVEIKLSYLLQASQAKVWMAWGIHPDAVMGWGVGQYTAAAIAGSICFVDAFELVNRSTDLIESTGLESDWEEFETAADDFNFYPPNLPLVCSVSGELIPVHRSLGGSYWRDQATSAPNLDAAIKSLLALEFNACLSLGCDAETFNSLQNYKNECKFFASTASESEFAAEMMTVLGQLYELGCNPDFDAVFDAIPRKRLSLPTYPFQKKRYWITEISQFLETDEASSELNTVRS